MRAATKTRLAVTASSVGAFVFFVGTSLHPPRDGEGISAVGELYGLTHAIQAIGLMLVALGLANLLASTRDQWSGLFGPVNTALAGTLAWLGLIVFDGAHNPALAQHAPELVHRGASLDIGAALLVIPALILFPLGHGVFAFALMRRRISPGLLLGLGALTYTVGGALILPLGPDSVLVQPLEVAGSLMFAIGYLLVSRVAVTPGRAI